MAVANPPTFEFHYDISCPFAYIASTRVEALAQRAQANLIWRPVLLGAIYRATAAPQGAAGSASDVFNPTKKQVSSRSLHRTIKRYRIPYNPPPQHPRKTTAALRLIYHVPVSERVVLTKALFKAYWVEGKDVADHDMLLSIAKESGIPSAEKMTKVVFENSDDRQSLERATADAIERGTPGVPAFWIPNETWTDFNGVSHRGRLYWGQDRMHFVEAMLLSLRSNSSDLSTVPNLGTLMPRTIHSTKLSTKVKLEFWYDFSSPWAFLGWTQLNRLQRLFGKDLEIIMKPFLLGALFKEIGAPMVPMAVISQQKRVYMRNDLGDWIRFWNAVNAQEGNHHETIHFRWPDIFPIRTPVALRCALAEPDCVSTIYRACWEQNADVSTEEVLADVLTKVGYSGQDILEQASSAEVKNKLRQHTQEAKDIGLCGVPSYRVFWQGADGGWNQAPGTVWGQDETAIVQDLITGWDEDSIAGLADVGLDHQKRGKETARL